MWRIWWRKQNKKGNHLFQFRQSPLFKNLPQKKNSIMT
jgi:hypothetical protein